MLYLLIHDLPVPANLPEAWRRKWEAVLDRALPATLHDPDLSVDIPNRREIAHRNRQVAVRLLEAAEQYWF